jgi:DNA-directed RNA polymerase beta' subunit
VLDKQDCNKFYFKKIVRSFFGKIIDKVTKSDKEKEKIEEKEKKGFEITGKKIIKAFSGEDWENKVIKYQSDASYLNLLTLIIGSISIEMKGKSAFICFSQKHASKILDHMCVKAYKN